MTSPFKKMDNDTLRSVLIALWEAMPETRTHAHNIEPDDMLRMRFALKLAGFDWREDGDISRLMAGAYKLGIINADFAHRQHWRGKHPDEAIDFEPA